MSRYTVLSQLLNWIERGSSLPPRSCPRLPLRRPCILAFTLSLNHIFPSTPRFSSRPGIISMGSREPVSPTFSNSLIQKKIHRLHGWNCRRRSRPRRSNDCTITVRSSPAIESLLKPLSFPLARGARQTHHRYNQSPVPPIALSKSLSVQFRNGGQ